MFDKAVEGIIAEYDKRHNEELEIMCKLSDKEKEQRRNSFLIPVGRHVAQFLNNLMKDAGAKTALEIGTAYGFSTVWLAEAARSVDGKLISLELDPDKVDYASNMIERADLEKYVEFRVGDALESIKVMTETIDLVLLDLWKELYVPCLDLFYPKLSSQAIIVADNMLYPQFSHEQTLAYQQRVRSMPNIESVLLPLGSGIEVSRINRPID